MVKNLPANVGDLGLEDHLEKGITTHSSGLAWIVPWTEEPIVPRVAKNQTHPE